MTELQGILARTGLFHDLRTGDTLRINPRFAILFVTSNANIEEESLVATIAEIGSRLLHVHLCENGRGMPCSGSGPFRKVTGDSNTRSQKGVPGAISNLLMTLKCRLRSGCHLDSVSRCHQRAEYEAHL